MTPLQMELHAERKARLARMAPRPRISVVRTPIPAPVPEPKPIKTWFHILPAGEVVAFPGTTPPASYKLRVADVKREVAEYFDVAVRDLDSSRRTANVVRHRQIAMYLARRLTGNSLPEIGRRFGGKDHTTILHAVSVCERILAQEEKFAPDIRKLFAKLEKCE